MKASRITRARPKIRGQAKGLRNARRGPTPRCANPNQRFDKKAAAGQAGLYRQKPKARPAPAAICKTGIRQEIKEEQKSGIDEMGKRGSGVFSTLALMGAVRKSRPSATRLRAAVRIDADFAPTVGAAGTGLRGGGRAGRPSSIPDRAGGRGSGGAGIPGAGKSCVNLARSYVGMAVKAGRAHIRTSQPKPISRRRLLGGPAGRGPNSPESAPAGSFFRPTDRADGNRPAEINAKGARRSVGLYPPSGSSPARPTSRSNRSASSNWVPRR